MKKVLVLFVLALSIFSFAQDDMNHDAMMMVESHAWGKAELANARTLTSQANLFTWKFLPPGVLTVKNN
jgi:hypothetical protein